jgi:predicted ATPase
VTFLFTDIEGSTRLWEADADAMRVALAAHDAVLREAIEARGGWLFKHTGDGVCAVFRSAAAAVDAAIDAQRRLGLPVRMGVVTGEAELQGADYFGPALNRAARVMAAGHGGQILCSAATAELARPALGPDKVLRTLGTFRLKDLMAPETVFQIDAPDLESTFPPLRTLDVARHNLPVQQTRLIGRHGEVAALLEALGCSRLVTLAGVGGCGKTRLALAVGAELVASSGESVFFVALAPVASGDGIVAAVTAAMGVRLAREEQSALVRYLDGRDVVLILDNCEHLLDEISDLVDALLSDTTGPRVVATSREALGAAAEHVLRVPSLAVDSKAGEESSAVTLLVERAQRAGASLTRLIEDHDVLVEICERLDGIPLAIELAAARLEQLSPADLLARLDQRFDLLVGGHGRRRQRQQTLQAVMDWSWELLTGDERRLLAILSVIADRWTLANAEILGGHFVDGSVALVLAALVAKSLVEPLPASSPGRYRLLETVRLFASTKLVELGMADDARAAHAQLYVDLARSVPPERAFNDVDMIYRVQSELVDIGSAIGWLTRHEAPSQAAELVVLCGGCYSQDFSARRGVDEVAMLRSRVDSRVLRARMLIAGTFAAVASGDHQLTVEWAAEALALADGHDSFAASEAAFLTAGPLILVDPDTASALLMKAHEQAHQHGSPLQTGIVQLWLNMAQLCVPHLDVPVADEHETAAFGGPRSMGWMVARQVGALRLAEHGHREEALALLQPMGSLSADVDDRVYRLAVEALAGDPTTVPNLASVAIIDIDRRSDVLWHAELVVILGIAHTRADRLPDAVIHLEAAKRAPMVLPFWYALARRFGRQARAALDPTATKDAIERARHLTVEQLLDDQVRSPTPRIIS